MQFKLLNPDQLTYMRMKRMHSHSISFYIHKILGSQYKFSTAPFLNSLVYELEKRFGHKKGLPKTITHLKDVPNQEQKPFLCKSSHI